MASIVVATLVVAAALMVSGREAQLAVKRLTLRSAAIGAAECALGDLAAAAGGDVGFGYVGPDGVLVQAREAQRTAMRRQVVDEETGVRWGYEIQDLSQLWDERAAALASSRATAWAKSRLGRQALSVGPLSVPPVGATALALELGEREFFHASVGRPALAGTGWGGLGLLTDPVRGGWKRNLSDPATLAEVVGPELTKRLLAPDAAFAADPAKGLPPSVSAAGPYRLAHVPVLVDFRLSLGFFNSRADGRHRLRFHASGRWWNPSAAPVLADANHNLYLVEVDGAPEVEVRNLNTGSAFIVDLDDCPQENFGIFAQGLREQGLWLWAAVADGQTHGMARRGLLPGEVYGFVTPSASAQPQGLARILTKTTWRLDEAAHGPTWVRPSPEVFRPSDRIAINVRFRGPVTLRFRPAVGPAPADRAIGEYPSAPQLVLANVPFPDFAIETDGADYSRPDSSNYTLSERRACLRLSLRERTSAEWMAGVREGRLAKTSWDLAQPADAAEWDIANPLLSVLDLQDCPTSPAESVLWDRVVDQHAAGESGAFARLVVRDIPASPLVGVAGLAALVSEGNQEWQNSFDRAFVGAPGAVAGFSENPRMVSAAPDPTAARVDLRSPQAAAGWCVAGPFNVNSRDVDAWERLLSASPYAWSSDAGAPVASPPLTGSWFCTLPSGAQLAPYGVAQAVNLADVVWSGRSSAELRELAGQQAVRELTPAMTRRWAEAIVAEQPRQGWPYPSLEAFAASGLLAKALEVAEVNRALGADGSSGPAVLRPAHFLQTFGPLLTIRGDTFRIIARATSPNGDASVEVEWVVQRLPEPQAIPALGRRYRVIRARIRPG